MKLKQARVLASMAASEIQYAAGIVRHHLLGWGRASHIAEVAHGSLSVKGLAKVAILLNFDKLSMLHRYVLHQVDALAAAGFAVIFVTNSDRLAPDDLAALAARCHAVVRRRNRGYDFGAWRDAIVGLTDTDDLQALLLANDSVYGPFGPLDEILAQMDAGQADLWALTDSWQRRFHLQSYFMLAHRRTLQSAQWQQFWRDFHHSANKEFVVRQYEIGLTQRLLRAGLRCRALYAYDQLAREVTAAALRNPTFADSVYLRHISDAMARAVPVNVTHFLWDYMIRRHGFPFIKRDLLMHNRQLVPQVHTWREVVQEQFDFDVTMVDDHLKLGLTNRWR